MFSSRIPWIVLLLVWMAGAAWWHVCTIKLLCADDPEPGITTTEPAPAVAPPLVVVDGDRFRYASPDNIGFPVSGAVTNTARIAPLFDALAHYLTAHPGKILLINGYNAPNERNATAFATLGLARADYIMQALKKRGISDSLLVISGRTATHLVASATGDSLYGGLNFGFKTTAPPTPTAPTPAITTAKTPAPEPLITLTEPVTEKELAAKEKFSSVFQPIDLYFQLSGATFIQTDETKKFFKEASEYLNENQGKKLVLTGYTDNTGPDLTNLKLSRERANGVKNRLRKLGIDSDQIRVDARGEADPKADNSTLSGRKANRRVTVVVQ